MDSSDQLNSDTEFILKSSSLENQSDLIDETPFISHQVTKNCILNEKKFNQTRKIHSSPVKRLSRRFSHDSENGSARNGNSLYVRLKL